MNNLEALDRAPVSFALLHLHKLMGKPSPIPSVELAQIFIVRSITDAREFESAEEAEAVAEKYRAITPADDSGFPKYEARQSVLHRRKFVVGFQSKAGKFFVGVAPLVGGLVTVPSSAF